MKFKSLDLIETKYLTDNKETEEWARELFPQIAERQVIGLKGSLGSGKTHFVKSLAKAMGCSQSLINSPTFALHHEYPMELGDLTLSSTNKKILSLHHWDLYRLTSDEEIESSGFWDLFYEKNILILIEWIERIPEKSIPLNFSYWRIDWEVLSDGRRQVCRYQR